LICVEPVGAGAAVFVWCDEDIDDGDDIAMTGGTARPA
jgi:hypothetical protein